LFAQTGEIRGKKQQGAVSASFQFTPEQEQLRQMRGNLFFLVQIKGDSDDKSLGTARQLFTGFKDKFYAAAGSNLKAIEEAVDYLKGLVKQQGLEADVAVANLWGSVLYVAKIGEAGLILVRKGAAKKIDVTKVASGVLQDGDNVFLADPLFLKEADFTFLADQTLREDFDESLKAIHEGIKEKEGNAFSIRFSVQEPVETPQPILIADLDKGSKIYEPPSTQGALDSVRGRLPLHLPNVRIENRFLKDKAAQVRGFLTKVGQQLYPYARRASFIIASPWLPRAPGSIEEVSLKKRQRIIQIVVVLGAVLVISVVAGLINHTQTVKKERFEAVITSIEGKLADAEALKDINSIGARDYISQAQGELDKLSAKDPRVARLQKKLDILIEKVNKIYKIKLVSFRDLSALKGGIDTKELKLAGSSLFVMDVGTGSLYKVSLGEGTASILVSEKKGLQNMAPEAEFIYLQTKTEISKVDAQTGIESRVATSSPDWKNLIAADTYRSNLYLLDTDDKQVWKYAPFSDGLSGPQAYFSQDFKENFVSFAVDGAIWVASKNEIFKFFAGNKDKFVVKGAPGKFSNIKDVYTTEFLGNLYVLDKTESGIFVIEKTTGNYLGLYKAGEFTQAEAIAVDEAKKTVYTLINDTIFSFSLR